jgi:hypothetical protein
MKVHDATFDLCGNAGCYKIQSKYNHLKNCWIVRVELFCTVRKSASVLHLAITEGASMQVVEYLLEAYPSARKTKDSKGFFTICLCRMLSSSIVS